MPHSSGGAQYLFMPHFLDLLKSGKFLLKNIIYTDKKKLFQLFLKASVAK
jgi:hypothetical protein